MKNSDIETMGKIVFALGKYLPNTEFPLFKEFLEVYERLKGKNDREKQRYQDNAEFHREATRLWRQNNKERNAEYQKEYNKRKKQESGKD